MKLNNLNLKRSAKEQSRDRLREIAQQEADGTGGSMRRNLGPIYKVKKADADRVNQELTNLKAANDSLIADKISDIEMLRMAYTNEVEGLGREKYDGLAARIDALGNLIKKSQPIYWAQPVYFISYLLPSKPLRFLLS